MSTYDSKRPVQFVLFVSFAVLLLVNSAVAIRSLSAAAGASDRLAKSEPAGNRESGGERTLGGEEAESTEASTAGMDDLNEQCNDADDEECLIRRILAAHVDYIYTQHHKP